MIQLWNEGAYLVNGTELVADINEVTYKGKCCEEYDGLRHFGKSQYI